MRPSRKVARPELSLLEPRVALSHATGHAALVHSVQMPSAFVPNVATQNSFIQDVSQTLQTGTPVYDQWITSYSDGTSQTEYRLIVPTLTAPSTTLITTTKNIALRGGGQEFVIEKVTSAGNTTDSNITTTFPDGSTQSENDSAVQRGNQRQFNNAIHLPGDGGFRLVQGTTVSRGATSTTDQTVHEPDGTVEHDHIVVTTRGTREVTNETIRKANNPTRHVHTVAVHYGELDFSQTSTITQPGTAPQTLKSTTAVYRITPPGS